MQVPRFLALILLLVSTVYKASCSQQPSPSSQPTSDQGKQLSSETILSKSVVLITTWVQGETQPHGGTGLLVTVPDDRLPNTQAFSYLVTNRHVAEAIFRDPSGQCKSHPISHAFATLNLKTPVNGDRSVRVFLDPSVVGPWYFAQDSGIDLAVLSFGVTENYDAATVAAAAFLTPDLWEQFNIAPGDKLLTTGFFRLYAGVH